MKKNVSRKEDPAASESTEVKRGYNEKNPGQPHGAFKPDASKTTPKAPIKPSAPRKNKG